MKSVRELIKECIYNSTLNQKEFADKCGVSAPMVNEWLTGKRSITPSAAIHLEIGTGVPAEVWLAYQDYDDLVKLRTKENRQLLCRTNCKP